MCSVEVETETLSNIFINHLCVSPSVAATTPSHSAVCDFEQSLCGWSADPQSGVSWSLHTASSSSGGHGTHETRLDLALGSDSESTHGTGRIIQIHDGVITKQMGTGTFMAE